MLSTTSPLCDPFFLPTLHPFSFALTRPEAQHQRNSTTFREPNYRHHADEHAATVQVELPGVSTQNTSVQVEGNMMTVIGKMFDPVDQQALHSNKTPATSDTREKQGQSPDAPDVPAKENTPSPVQQTEERHKPRVVYKLVVRIPKRVQVDTIRAQQHDGILRLHLPFEPQKTPRNLNVPINA